MAKQPEVGEQCSITCYKEGCEHASISVTVGREFTVHSSFVRSGMDPGIGRIRIPAGSTVLGFELWEKFGGSGYCNCPNCNKLFGGVIAVIPPIGEAFLFGYDPEQGGD